MTAASRSVLAPCTVFLTLPFVQNGSFTTSAGSRSPRQSTSNFVPAFAAAAGR